MLKICDDCETAYAADLERCPHCLAEGFTWNHEQAGAAANPAPRTRRPRPPAVGDSP